MANVYDKPQPLVCLSDRGGGVNNLNRNDSEPNCRLTNNDTGLRDGPSKWWEFNKPWRWLFPSRSSSRKKITKVTSTSTSSSSSSSSSSSLSSRWSSLTLPSLKIKEKVSNIYYKYGLLCSTYPWLIILLTFTIFSFCVYPILGIHSFTNNYLQKYVTPLDNFYIHGKPVKDSSSSYSANHHSHSSHPHHYPNHQHQPNLEVIKDPPRWFQSGAPYAIIQQIIIKSAVIPWKNNHILMDAIRAPLAQVFPILEFLSNFQTDSGSKSVSLNDICLQINEPIGYSDNSASNILPRYSCLLFSPANIWKNDVDKFRQDATIIKTIFNTKDFSYLDSGNLREILFGVPWMETGIRPFYVRTRQRTLTFAITIAFSGYNKMFFENLRKQLRDRYPVNPLWENRHDDNKNNNTNGLADYSSDSPPIVTHLHFQNSFTFSVSSPIIGCYIFLFFYIYFSVRKIDLIKCKWALAASSVLTVVMCLLMTLGICSWFDFNPTLDGSEIFPYLIVIIGLENILVLTQSVIATPAHLDVKVRVAQGLSREGWSMNKNLIAELGLCVFGYFTFVPVIQEFCLFGMIALLCDFFLQMTIFITLLSVDIQRVELDGRPKKTSHSANDSKNKMNQAFEQGSHPYDSDSSRLNSISYWSKSSHMKLPKRLRLVYFWTRTRMAHRFLMMALIVWISILLYRSTVSDHYNQPDDEPMIKAQDAKLSAQQSVSHQIPAPIESTSKTLKENDYEASQHRLKYSNRDPRELLSSHNWFTLFGFYNISLSGKYLSFLPPIHLAIPVDPTEAHKIRHPSESDPQIFRQFLYPGSIHASFDQNDDWDEFSYDASNDLSNRPHWSPREILLALLLSTPTLTFIIYILVTMYRCMCSRRYDEWRSSWSSSNQSKGQDISRHKIDDYFLETMLVKRQAHQDEIEMVECSNESPYVVSCSMEGDLRVWDVLSGECHLLIQRSQSTDLIQLDENKQTTTATAATTSTFKPHHKPSSSFSSDSTYGSSPSTSSGDCVEQSFLPSNFDPSTLINNRISKSTVDKSKIGYDFKPFYSRLNSSKNLISELIVNAAASSDIDVNPYEITANLKRESNLSFQQIWCLDVYERFILVGCAEGRFEIWDTLTGLNHYNQECVTGITVIKARSGKLVIGRLNGICEIYQIENHFRPENNSCYILSSSSSSTLTSLSISSSISSSSSSSTTYINNTNTPPQSSSSSSSDQQPYQKQMLNTYLIHSIRAHSQPITALQLDSSHLITGSADHLIKVFKLETGSCSYTLHGHFGGISCLEIDKTTSNSALSGCKVGQVCLWDLTTGTCLFNLEAHADAAVTALLTTSLYAISSGTDNKINIWDKYSGHLVHSLPNQRSFCCGMVPLTPNILITAKEDHLILWDLSEATPLRIINLSSFGDNKSSCIKNLRIANKSRAVIADYGKNICIIHFPGVTQKSD
ncbi:sterol regulatory element-binding protein cleavage-activating protein-like [Panonychus citri]|uniref:sterol regulatory element-binding protein cleavage-activating protein-like n=1 Tax=Panonychus citri TaxID=50023 RepID=UPI002306E93B|nr:sterol regulatory element-binding protein cleavage-activating protein-like [Panonychus citri]